MKYLPEILEIILGSFCSILALLLISTTQVFILNCALDISLLIAFDSFPLAFSISDIADRIVLIADELKTISLPHRLHRTRLRLIISEISVLRSLLHFGFGQVSGMDESLIFGIDYYLLFIVVVLNKKSISFFMGDIMGNISNPEIAFTHIPLNKQFHNHYQCHNALMIHNYCRKRKAKLVPSKARNLGEVKQHLILIRSDGRKTRQFSPLIF